MTAHPTRRTRALVGALLGAAVLATALPGTAALASASPSPFPTPVPTPTPTRLPALPAPALTGPVGYGEALKEVVLDWEPVPGAVTYEVQVGVDDAWSDDPVWKATTRSTQVSVPEWLPHADHVWRVAALRPGGTGRWSASGSFRRDWTASPTPLRPAPREQVVGQYPEFRWTPVEGASAYEVQVSDDPAFSEDGLPTGAPTVPAGSAQDQARPRVDTCFTTHTRVTPFESNAAQHGDSPGPCSWTLLGTGEPRWWRVRALDRHADGEAPAVATSPASDEGVSHVAPEFDGKPDPDVVSACPKPADQQPGPTATASASASTSPSGSAAPSATPTPSAGPEPGDCTPAYPMEQGAWSGSVLFTVALEAQADDDQRFRRLPRPALADLVQDNPCVRVDGVVSCTDVPTVRWSPVAGAHAYRVYLSRTPSFSRIITTVDVPGLSFTPTGSFAETTAGAAVHVGVQACTPAGCGAVTADPPSFRKRAVPVALASPDDGSALPGGDVVFTWQTLHDALEAHARRTGAAEQSATQGASAYRLQVTRADDEDFRDVLEDVLVDQPRHATLDVDYGDGDLLWRVQALDGSMQRLPWSAAARFSRDTVAPTAEVLTRTPARPEVPFTVRFSEPVRGVAPGTVSVAPTGGALRLSADRRSATLTPALHWTPGRPYVLALGEGITDEVGNRLEPSVTTVRVDPLVDEGSPALGYLGTWASRRATDAHGGAVRTSTPAMRRQSAVTLHFHGKGVHVTGCTGPSGGMADVWVDGTKRLRIDTWRPWSSCGTVLARLALPMGDHRVQLRGVGLKRSRSTGTAVSVDTLRVQ